MPHRKRHLWIATLSAILYTAFLCWLYYPALDIFFAHDDWIFLTYASQIPPTEPWRYLNLHAVWFYRPLQTMQFGLTWYAAQLNPLPYNIQLIAMHLTMCILVWVFLRQMFGAGIATLSTILFSVSSMAPEILLWKSNFNSLHNALATIIAAICFVKYLKSRQSRWLWATVAAAVLNCFTKESCINLPLVLATIWITIHLQRKWIESNPAPTQKPLRQFVKDMIPVSVVTVAYILIHTIFFRNIEPLYKLQYQFAPPLKSLWQWAIGINHALFPIENDPLLVRQIPGLRIAVVWLVTYGVVIPPLLIILGWLRKSPTITFSILFIVSTLVPTFSLHQYLASRYYYLPVLGGSVFITALLWPAIQTAFLNGSTEQRNSSSALKTRIIGYAAATVLFWLFSANVIRFQQVMAEEHRKSVQSERVFRYLHSIRNQLPDQSLIIFQNVEARYNVGVNEMLTFATGRRDLYGVYENPIISESLRKELEELQVHFLLDVTAATPQLKRVR